MPFIYDSFDENYKRPFGCLCPDEFFDIAVKSENEEQARFFLEIRNEDGFFLSLPLKSDGIWHRGRLALSNTGLYFYRFRMERGEMKCRLGMDEGRKYLTENGGEWQISCIPSDFHTPEWSRGALMYQIFPDRFHRSGAPSTDGKLTPFHLHASTHEPPRQGADAQGYWNNDFFGGNLKGIEEKLPYLASLGVGVLYLNPIFFAFSNHRYDTADYKRIDPLLGNDEDFRSLCTAAHEMGMRVILDGVFSHVGSDSIYFDARHRFGQGAVSDPNSVWRQWFDFQSYPTKYTCWWNIDSLPCVNEMTPSYLRYIITDDDSVIAHWLKLGADGFRLDVADELPDEFILALRRRMKQIKPDALLIGEVWEDASNKISYGVRRTYFTKGELDSVMNYPFRALILSLIRGEINASAFEIGVMTILEHYPNTVIPCLMNSLSTHDTPRQWNSLKQSEDTPGLDRAILAAIFLQFMLPGMPCIYYGDEIGMRGESDPLNRGYFRWDQMDSSLLDFYRSLSSLRAEHESLQIGSFRFMHLPGCIAWKRETKSERVYGYLIIDPLNFQPPTKAGWIHQSKSDRPQKFDFGLWKDLQ